MHKVLSISSAMILAIALFAGCQQDPSSGITQPMPLKAPVSGTTTANPALVWSGYVYTKSHGQTTQYSAIFVGDSNLANSTSVQVAKDWIGAVAFDGAPGWSPTGSSICLTQRGYPQNGNTGTVPDTIKAFDISVNSSGVPVASNLRTIVGLADQTVRMNNAFWSSTTTMGKIAYSTADGSTNSVYVVDQSGLTAPSKIYSYDATGGVKLGDPTWNPDDSKLAFIRTSSTASTILIYNTSDWSLADTIDVSGQIFGLEWSRSGMNKLAFSVYASGSYHLYYCDPSTGATPTTNSVASNAGYPTWSPNNSSVMYVNAGTLYKNVPGTSTAASVGSFGSVGVKWKR
ncbi:MAG: hypothetical protein Q8916_05670 [Bacteroidota bacterium]|nr:hypothetical protein [Bacteroidota bacterium]MDP4229877.1 hypothetical protein [Bacteroidota bacterium]MDP4235837.1 hypothetical protein [Bacteroidota bacterium]